MKQPGCMPCLMPPTWPPHTVIDIHSMQITSRNMTVRTLLYVCLKR